MIKNIIKNLVGNASEILDEVITTDEERAAAKQKLEELFKNHEKNMFELEVEDRKSARDMYKDDSNIQKILAALFTVAYFILSFVMFRYFMIGDINLGEFEISFISTIFGAMSTKVSTICDFYFGTGSSKKEA
jgi:hypothetical protein|tara:strand:- start:230 stop:628 length:399 start_codon:yes stop_codon:yes gene_type:complete